MLAFRAFRVPVSRRGRAARAGRLADRDRLRDRQLPAAALLRHVVQGRLGESVSRVAVRAPIGNG